MTSQSPSRPPGQVSTHSGSRSCLETNGVEVHFVGVKALVDIDLHVSQGEIVGLIGPNGAGKTTLINVLSGFQKPTAGSVHLDGRDVTRWPAHRLARNGVVRTFQSVRVFEKLTVRENVEVAAFAAGMSRAKARSITAEVLAQVDLESSAHLEAASLSYGQERRLGIARALAAAPKILLLDEPAAGLDETEVTTSWRLCATCATTMTSACWSSSTTCDSSCGSAIVSRCWTTARRFARDHPMRCPATRGFWRHTSGADMAATRTGPRMLTVEAISVQYGNIRAVRGVSLNVDEGEIVGLLGPNGAGKTTTLSAVGGKHAPTAGRICLAGEDVTKRTPEEMVRRGVALVPEGRHIFGTLSVLENLLIGASIRRDKAAIKADIEVQLERFPVLRRYYKSEAGKLSGGEQQQLAIARALVSRPKLLLLDEPSLGLSPVLVDVIFDTIEQLRNEGLTILLVEQNAARAIEIADRCYVLRTGSVVADAQRGSLTAEDLGAIYLNTKDKP